MFDLTNFPSTSEVISVYASVAASTMFVRTMANEFVPHQLRGYILSGLRHIFGHLSSTLLTVTIDEYNGLHVNEIFEASEIYLSSKIPPTIQKIRVSKAPRDKNFSIGIEKNQEIIDVFDGIQLKWKFICTEKSVPDCKRDRESRSFELNFNKKHKDVVLASYLPYVLNKSKALKEENEVVKLLSLGHFYGGGGEWRSINLDHPATLDKLAMDPDLKRALIEDLNKFVRRREFYRRVGKAWKRGYLLYGPPGTGKSSLIAAMANYLKFNIYDIELASLHSNAELRGLLVSTSNRSIIVIEDIDCSIDLEDRRFGRRSDKQLTLSGLLNFIDGLWSSCGDELIIVFTTNHLDRLDPALLRPGRMDMHIHMTYCTIPGFKLLASNYLGIHNHRLFKEIEGLILEKVELTPAEVAEELMKSEDAEVALQGLISFIHRKKKERDEIEALTNTSDPASEEGEERQTTEDQKLNWHRSETNKRKRINRLSTGVKSDEK